MSAPVPPRRPGVVPCGPPAEVVVRVCPFCGGEPVAATDYCEECDVARGDWLRVRYRIAGDEARVGRVFVGPEPERGAHSGFRGPLRVDALGVHLLASDGVEGIFPVDDGSEWPMGAWDFVESDMLVPWARVFLIEWGPCGWERAA